MLVIMKQAMVAAALGAVLMAAVPAPAGATEPAEGTGGAVAARTASSTTHVRPDGTRTLTLYSGPVQLPRGAREGPAAWVPVDLTLAPRPDGVIAPVAMAHDLRLTPAGPAVDFAGGGSAALDWAAPLPAPVLDAHRATYPQAAPGYDLVVEATSVGFVASLHRAGPAAGPVPPLALRGSAEAVPDDAPGPHRPAAARTETASAVSRVVAAAPPAGAVPFDTTVQTTVLRTDTSGEPDLRIGSYDGVAVARSYLSWDLAGVLGQPVATATLRMYQGWSASCRPRAWQVLGSPAVGPATRWANQPAADRVAATSTDTRGHGAGCAAGWTEVDVTGLVRDWAAAGVPSATMQLRAADEADPLSWKRFGSAESPNAPRLDVTFSPAAR